ncbi:MAG TPA: FlgD immunoglobulin-like domain containing protein [Rectinema sp.]|nr:FlgD immunoglobulin-like domain containing protein [Rectinema sp.]
MKKARVSAMMLILVSFSIVGVYAYDPPKGASLLGRIYGPWTMGGGLSLTEKGDNTWNFLLNPASTSEEELPILALSYTGIADTSAGGPQGWGSAAMAAFSLPKAYGVWNGSVRLFSAPSSMTSMPFGTFATIGGGFSKKISSGLSVGASAWLAMGGNGSFGWGLWSDIGIVEEFGDMGFLKSPRLGFAFSGIGKEFNYETPPIGMSPGSTASSGFPSAFSPSLGFSADLLNDGILRIMANIDLRAPSFADLEGEIGLGISYRNMLNLRISAAESLYDIQKKTGRSLWPSITISGSIPLGSKDPQNKGVSAILPAFGFMPLYDSLNSFSIGAQIAWRQHDMSPPEVKLELPPSVGGPPVAYISPNDDSKQDKLEIPLSVKDEQGIVAGWLFKIEDRSSGKVVRTITEQSDLPDRIDSFSSIKKGFGYTKQNVPVPNILDWDGRDDEGNPVPDGTYIVSFHAWDDLGKTNANYDSCMNVVVDRSAPIVNAWVLGSEQLLQGFDVMIFSPDGDNSKDTISFRVQGSIEDNWKYEILNENNVAIRTMEIKARSAPRDFVWDGTDDRGKRVPDGYYRFRLSTMDPAGNTGYKIIGISDDKSDWIVVDTSRPAVKVVADKKAFSPKKEGEAGTAQISFELESLDNLVTWKEFIQDQNGKTVWTSSGDGSAPPPESFRFGGRDPSGEVLPDGQYRAGIEMKYRNGYSPLSYSESFILDATPPFATIVLDDIRAIFSPDGDGRRDTLAFSLSGSKEDTWKLSIFDEIGKPVYTREYREALPERFEWDGTDSTGRRVIDNKYTLEIESVDVAGNEFKVGFEPVVVDTRTPSAFFVLNREAFSPNDDGIADILGVKLKIDSIDGLLDWKLYVSSALNGSVNAEKTGRQIALLQGDGTNSPPTDFQFDGKGEGALLKEGTYRFELFLEYENGWKTTKLSPEFVIDITAPRAQISRSREFFNPRGETKQSQVIISQIGSREALWIGELRDNQGVLRCKWESKDSQPSEILWDGRTAEGALLPDGIYSYRLFCIDLAGNSFASEPILIGIDTVVKQSSLSADTMAISPNGDGIQDKMTLSISATAMESVQDWQLAILAGQERVMEWKGTGKVPQTIIWEGISLTRLPVPDGSYAAIFRAEYPNGDSTEASLGPLIVDRIAPQATVSLSRLIFSPNGDGINDTMRIEQDSVGKDRWQGSILDLAGKAVCTWSWEEAVRSFEWDGRDSAGNVAVDGKYRYQLVSKDAAGNGFSYISPIFEIETEKKAVRLTVGDRAFSPNGDGVKDVQTIKAEVVSPEKVKEYVLQIVAQDGPAALSAVRTWKGETPRSVYEWKGETDAQIQAPDGHYAASMKVVYRNGDEAEGATGTFLLDRQYPRIEVHIQGSIFSPDGDGRSDTILITQKSLPGDDWKGVIKDSNGNIVQSWNWQNEAKDLVWDGSNMSGSTVSDGYYVYSVESEDIAGNKTVVGPFQIQVETGRRTVQLRLSDKAISPNGDGIKDELVINVDVDARDRIKQFNLAIRSKDGAVMKAWTGGADLSREYRWTGTNEAGAAVPDGDYNVSLEVLYLNDAFAKAGPMAVLVDRIAPQATVSLSRLIFSPNGDGRADTVELIQSSVYGDRWNGQIISETGKIVRTWEWYPMLADVLWDGKDQSGKLVSDGVYYYELRSIDAAGNFFILPRQQIIVDAAQKNVSFKVEPTAFSPNDDGVKDLIYLNVNAPKPDTLLSYSLSIFAGSKAAAGQAPVRSWKGKIDIKSQYVWDGMTDAGLKVPDGYYSTYLELEYANGDLFNFGPIQILVDTVPPRISISADPLLFSPNGDGIKDTITIAQESVPGDDWSGRIRSASGATVRSYTWKGQAKNFTWDGKDSNGKLVPNGAYSYEVVSVDAAGNSASASIKGIMVDATKPRVFVTASDNGISPNSDGIRDEVSFSLTVENREGVDSWRFSLLDSKGVERSFFGGSGSDVPTRLVWDGRDLNGQVIEDTFTGKLIVRYMKGDIAEATSSKIVVKIAPPQVEIKVKPEYFSPDDDGVDDMLTFGIVADKNAGITEWKLEVLETAIVESAALQESKPTRSFMLWSGKGMPPSQITWNGKSPKGELVESATDYPFEFTCWDALGNQTKISGIIAVDVLVIRDGDRLKIRVPSIVFRANHADFIGLDSEIVARNEKVVTRIAQILGKFPDYRIRVEGHGNNVGKMLGYSASRIQQEEINELIPLSTERAEVVRKMLVENGVDARRLTVVGLGSSEPVVPFTDVQNRWKNRRVEFVLIKNQ